MKENPFSPETPDQSVCIQHFECWVKPKSWKSSYFSASSRIFSPYAFMEGNTPIFRLYLM